MQRFLSYAALIALATMLSGCFDSSGSNNSRPDPAVDFSQFVKTEIENTDDRAEPVSINKKEFGFNDQTNEQAFDELFIQ
jgi:PBP1b-binding outer membrane lipoprotein LpoB